MMDDMALMALPRCSFHERTAVEGGYRYDNINMKGPAGDNALYTPHPPAVGDLIILWDASAGKGGAYVVVARQWLHPSWGSVDWPYGQAAPTAGPLLDIVVEAADGVFRDEVAEEDQ